MALNLTRGQEALVQDSAELLDLAQEAGHLGLFEWRVQAGLIRISPKLMELYGLAEFDGRYESWLACLFSEDVIRTRDQMDRAFANRLREYQMEFRFCRRPDNAVRWMEARHLVIYEDSGQPDRMVGVHADVTDRKRALVQLRAFTETLEESVKEGTRLLQRLYGDLEEREAKIRRLVDANIIGILIWDLEGRILDANDAFLRTVGYDRDDLTSGRIRWTDLTPAEWRDSDAAAVAELKSVGTVQPFEKEYFRKDGSRVPILIGGATFEQDGAQGVAFVLDLTERKRAEAEARESERRYRAVQMELAHANRVATLGQLTASIAHEVKQPITATATNASAALRWLSARPPELEEARQALDRIVRDSGRAAAVIDRVHALVKRAPQRQDRLMINEVILEVVALTRSEAAKNGVSVQTELADALALIQGDRVQLQQVVLNLIINAVEAMSGSSEGARELRIITGEAEPDGVLVAVRDAGPGLAPDSVEHVFDAFYTTKPGGLGLGLSICQSIIKAHGGRLWASANAPRGAIFQFTVPAHPGSAS